MLEQLLPNFVNFETLKGLAHMVEISTIDEKYEHTEMKDADKRFLLYSLIEIYFVFYG